MKKLIITLTFSITIIQCVHTQNNSPAKSGNPSAKVLAFKNLLASLSRKPGNTLFNKSCSSILSLLNRYNPLSANETDLLEKTYDSFINEQVNGTPGKSESYLQRKRPFIISWVSPTDHVLSFSWLRLPKNWDPQKKYPLYVMLHGDWPVAASPIEYLTYPLLFPLSAGDPSTAFEDGYLLNPWGRGNNWYHGIGETDIRENINELEKLVKIDPKRKYLCGHSMGGYGAWNISRSSPEIWAGVGLYSAALWHDGRIVSPGAEQLKKISVYFACGVNEGLKPINEEAYGLLNKAGNTRIKFVLFEHGHEYHNEDVEAMYQWLRKYKKE